ncbi:hypothetical protein E4H04_01065 [Candidatus Bathyarchaeota archaeon]|nr:hypothetical protein [Candidatus Bathyarchaeota archaeon]TFH19156.1 MAG: hypothetical protein E4H04_01065 [Candidatus Bathyarchaeota archaeon]
MKTKILNSGKAVETLHQIKSLDAIHHRSSFSKPEIQDRYKESDLSGHDKSCMSA